MINKKDIYSKEALLHQLIPVFEQYQVKCAILFGSYGKGTPGQNSDIDLFDIRHIIPNSKIESEIKNSGVVLYEKQGDSTQ